MIDTKLIQAGTGCTPATAARFQAVISAACQKYQINTPARLAAFLAQIGHESEGLVYSAEIWGPTPAQKRYDSRADLGNTRPEAVAIAKGHGMGPGQWFKGHGWIQTTGYDNHLATGKALGLDLVNHPDLLAQPQYAALSAAWFFSTHGCNTLADAGNFLAICGVVNCGNPHAKPTQINGYSQRCALHAAAQKVSSAAQAA